VEKKSDQDRHLSELVEDLIADVGSDRERLTGFLDGLISTYPGEGAVGIAEYVAKLFEAATRQHQVKVGIIKAMSKSLPDESDDTDDINSEIGLPFKDEVIEDGSN
jgi:hypothetical protein